MKKLLSALLVLTLAISLMGGALAETTWESENLTWKTKTEPITFSLFHNMTWAPMDVWGDDHVSQQVTADTGISFEVTKQQDAQQRQPRPSGHTKKNQQDTDCQQQATGNHQHTILARVTFLIGHGVHLARYEGMRQ